MTVFVGIDLAWSGRNPSGICVIRGDVARPRCDALCSVTASPESVFGWLQRLGPDVIAAVDAPLVVGERRRAEAEMARAHRGTGLYAYSARWDFLSRHGIVAGPELGALLQAQGWNLDPGRVSPVGLHAVEVFPHAVAVSLLSPRRMFHYKKGRRAGRLEEFAAFQAALVGLATEACASVLEGPAGVRLSADACRLTGRLLKAHEDELDAIACALAAVHFGRCGPSGMRVFGDAAEGYIAVPVPTSAPGRSCP